MLTLGVVVPHDLMVNTIVAATAASSTPSPWWVTIVAASVGAGAAIIVGIITALATGHRENVRWGRERTERDRQWQRERDERREQWKREDSLRWVPTRQEAYAQLIANLRDWNSECHGLAELVTARCRWRLLGGDSDSAIRAGRVPCPAWAPYGRLYRQRGMIAMDVDRLTLQVLPTADSDAEELADLAGDLHAELLDVDAASVAPLPAKAAPEGAKGFGDLAGWLLVQFGTPDGLRAAVAVISRFTSRTGRTVRVRIGGDSLEVTGASSRQQAEIIDAWLTRHAPGA